MEGVSLRNTPAGAGSEGELKGKDPVALGGGAVLNQHSVSVLPTRDRVRVTAAEFTRKFGQLTKLHRNTPIHVTNHGQETHVLVAADLYEQLASGAAQATAASGSDLPTLTDLGAWIRQGLIVLDREMKVRYANPVAYMMAQLPEGSLMGRDLLEVLPQLKDSLLSGYLQRTISGGERQTADLPLPFRSEDVWYRADVIPNLHGATLLLTDISDDVRRYRLADAKVALVTALDQHGGIGYARVNVRARIERVDATLSQMLSMPEERLVGNYITDLVPVADRVAFKDNLEAVLSGQATLSCRTRMITNQGTVIPVKVAIAELRGAYGGEGAVLVITDHMDGDED
jgi:PAS domain-containing protein